MIFRSMRRSVPLMAVIALVLLYFTRDIMTGCLIAPLGYHSYVSVTEPDLPVVIIPVFAFNVNSPVSIAL